MQVAVWHMVGPKSSPDLSGTIAVYASEEVARGKAETTGRQYSGFRWLTPEEGTRVGSRRHDAVATFCSVAGDASSAYYIFIDVCTVG